jgi:hypothetical protein
VPVSLHMNRRLFTNTIRGFLPGAPGMVPRYVRRNVAAYGPPHWASLMCRCFVVPDLKDCRDFYDSMTGTKHDWPEIVDDKPLLDHDGSEL